MDDTNYTNEEREIQEKKNTKEKFIGSMRILKKMILLYSQEELENKLYETDCYGCTTLHYACRYYLKEVAFLIIENTLIESNLYKLTDYKHSALSICCQKHNSHTIFNKILQKTTNEDYLYLGNISPLMFCMIMNQPKKAITILNKTQKDVNIYKSRVNSCPLKLSIELGYFNISNRIIEKTQTAKYLNVLPMFNSINPKHNILLNKICKKYKKKNEIIKMKLNHIFVKNNSPLCLDIVDYIGSFLYYPTRKFAPHNIIVKV